MIPSAAKHKAPELVALLWTTAQSGNIAFFNLTQTQALVIPHDRIILFLAQSENEVAYFCARIRI